MYNIVMRTVYIETSIVSYLTSRPSRDIRVAAWQEITTQWWEQERSKYQLFTSELVITEAGDGDEDAAQIRLDRLKDIPVLAIDDVIKQFAAQINPRRRRACRSPSRCIAHRDRICPRIGLFANVELPPY